MPTKESIIFDSEFELNSIGKHCLGYLSNLILKFRSFRNTTFPYDYKTTPKFHSVIKQGCEQFLNDFDYKTEVSGEETLAIQALYKRNFLNY